MEYGLLTLEACVAFLMLLLSMYNGKNIEKTGKSTCFKAYIYSIIIYGITVVVSIILMKFTPVSDGIIFKVIWRISYILLLYTIGIIFLYGLSTVHKIKETNFLKILTYNFDTKFIAVECLLVSIFFCMPIHIKGIDFINKDNIIFINTRSALFMVGLLMIATIFYFARIGKYLKENSKEFTICNIVAVLAIGANFGFHIIYHESSLMILPLAFIAFMMYYLIENPDIKLIEEEKKVNAMLSNESNKKIDLFEKIDYNLLNDYNEIKTFCNKTKQSESIEEKLDNIKKLNKKSMQLLENFDNIFKNVTTNQDDTVSNEYDIIELITMLKNYAKSNLEDKNVKLVLNISPNLSKKYYGDYEKIVTSLTGLISYSCKVTTIGRITINVFSEKENNNDILIFRIIDTSNGLNEEEYKNAYQTISQLDVCNKYITMMNGKFTYTTNYRLGNTFVINLEQMIADASPIGDINEIKSVESTGVEIKELSNKIVLIVDDDANNAKLTQRILSRYKLQTKIVNSASECINLIKVDERFDMIFMDIIMKDIDGIETLHILKDLEGYQLPKIVALTANALPGMKEKLLKEGFDDYISKPIDKNELERIINKFLN